MGSSRLSEALRHLAGGLQTIAGYRADNERIEGQRQFQREMQESTQQFSQRMQELQMQHGENMQMRSQEFQSAEGQKDRDFRMQQFNAEQGALNARHAQSMAAQWASVKQAAATRADAIADRDLQRQLKVYELGVTQASAQYQSLSEQMNKELAKLSENAVMALDPKKMDAATAKIAERYTQQIEEAKAKMQENIDAYASAVGIQKPGFDVTTKVDSTAQPGTPQTNTSKPTGYAGMLNNLEGTYSPDGGDSAMDRGKITQAVEAARAQLGGAIPNEANLISGFMKAGLTRAEAVNAARQLRSSPR